MYIRCSFHSNFADVWHPFLSFYFSWVDILCMYLLFLGVYSDVPVVQIGRFGFWKVFTLTVHGQQFLSKTFIVIASGQYFPCIGLDFLCRIEKNIIGHLRVILPMEYSSLIWSSTWTSPQAPKLLILLPQQRR